MTRTHRFNFLKALRGRLRSRRLDLGHCGFEERRNSVCSEHLRCRAVFLDVVEKGVFVVQSLLGQRLGLRLVEPWPLRISKQTTHARPMVVFPNQAESRKWTMEQPQDRRMLDNDDDDANTQTDLSSSARCSCAIGGSIRALILEALETLRFCSPFMLFACLQRRHLIKTQNQHTLEENRSTTDIFDTHAKRHGKSPQ